MPEKMTLHHKDGSTATMDAVDARDVLRNHSSEWAATPFPAEQKTSSVSPVSTAPAAPAAPVGPFEAREKGKGWWAIYDASGAEIGKSIREPDGVAFNAMSDEDKTEYVKLHTAEG